MARALTVGEDPNDVLSKISSFIGNEDNTNSVMSSIGDIMKNVDTLEMVVNRIEDEKYKNEMLGYIMMIRQYTSSVLDAFDSMMEI